MQNNHIRQAQNAFVNALYKHFRRSANRYLLCTLQTDQSKRKLFVFMRLTSDQNNRTFLSIDKQIGASANAFLMLLCALELFRTIEFSCLTIDKQIRASANASFSVAMRFRTISEQSQMACLT